MQALEMKTKNELIDHFLAEGSWELRARLERDDLVKCMNNMSSWTHDPESGETWMQYLLGDSPWPVTENLIREIKSCGFNIAQISTGYENARYIRITYPR